MESIAIASARLQIDTTIFNLKKCQGYSDCMPQFAANLHYLFSELPFLDRFEAAAAAGFRAVEFQVPYDYPAAELLARLRSNALKMVLFDCWKGISPRASGKTSSYCVMFRLPAFPAATNRRPGKSTIRICSTCSTNWATGDGSAANTGPGTVPGRACRGPQNMASITRGLPRRSKR